MAGQDKRPKFSESITDKYKLSGLLQASRTHFGPAYGNTTIDLSKAPVEVVDEFVERYPNQKFFLPKVKAEDAPKKKAEDTAKGRKLKKDLDTNKITQAEYDSQLAALQAELDKEQ